MVQVAAFTLFALLLARALGAPRGTWRYILAAAAAVLAASQLLPAGNAFREDVRDGLGPLLWLAVAAVPIVAYALLIRRLRARNRVEPPPPPRGLVLVRDDELLARDTARALAADEGAETVSVGWRADDGAMAGHARLRLAGGTAELALLRVRPEARGQGIGARLLAQAEAEARERGAARMVATATGAAKGFLTRRGYTVYGRLEGGPVHLVKELA